MIKLKSRNILLWKNLFAITLFSLRLFVLFHRTFAFENISLQWCAFCICTFLNHEYMLFLSVGLPLLAVIRVHRAAHFKIDCAVHSQRNLINAHQKDKTQTPSAIHYADQSILSISNGVSNERLKSWPIFIIFIGFSHWRTVIAQKYFGTIKQLKN